MALNPLSCILDLALPRTCVVCGRDLMMHERHICTTCLEDLPLTHFEHCSHNPMADRLNAQLEKGPYAYATALFYYTGGYAQITKALKFHRNFALGQHFAGMLGRNIALSEYLADVDLVTGVPLHWTRKMTRGYNQAELLAREVARVLEVEYADILERRRRTARQAKIGGENEAEMRAGNVRGAFALLSDADRRLKGKRHILVIDDVFTSGATLSECIKTITEGNSTARVSAATAAYAR